MDERRLVDHARSRRTDPTLAEKVLWSRLRRRQLGVRFRREDPFDRYVADFSCRAARLIVETDGMSHTDGERDRRRDAWFAQRGWYVLRFTDNEVLHDIDAVVSTILDAVRARVPTQPTRSVDHGGRLND